MLCLLDPFVVVNTLFMIKISHSSLIESAATLAQGSLNAS